MKQSLDHLPEKKQSEIHQIVEIIQDVLHPEMIILFGSYAKGKWVEDRYQGGDGVRYEYISDYDFLIVVDKVTEETSDQEWAIEKRAETFEPPVNLEIHEIGYINTGLETGQYFFTDIIKEGIVLYDTGKVTFSKPRELTKEEEKIIAQSHFDIWFNKGCEFLIDASNAYERKSLNNSAFYLHQATENFYYSILLVFTGYKPKTHNLKKLRRKTKHLSESVFLIFSVEVVKEHKLLFDLLKRSYIDARYKNNYVVAESEVSQILDKVNLMKDVVNTVCSEHIRSIGN